MTVYIDLPAPIFLGALFFRLPAIDLFNHNYMIINLIFYFIL